MDKSRLTRGDQNNSVGADEAFSKAVDIDPNDTTPWMNIAGGRSHQKNFAGMEQALLKAVSLDPNSAYMWEGLGLAAGAKRTMPERRKHS